MRLPMSVTVKSNVYSDDNLFEDVEKYDARREAIDQTPPAEQLDVDRFGVAASYGWSEKRTRQYAEPARADFGAYIRQQGFKLS